MTTPPPLPETDKESTAPSPNSALPALNNEPPAFGWSAYAERLNGRFAMIGFIALLLLELWTRQDFFSWLGLP